MALTATADRPYGWRARVAMISPTPVHTNHSYGFYQNALDGVTIVMTSLGVVRANHEALMSARRRLLRVALARAAGLTRPR